MVGIGLISYSLYLWHWPLIVFTEYLLFRPLRSGEIVLVICATFAIAFLSWRYVERPFRRRSYAPRRTVAIGVGVFASLACAGAVALTLSLARPEPAPYLAFAESQRAYGVGTCLIDGTWRQWKGESCFLTPRRQRNVLLWGDSFAAHYAHGLAHPSSAYGVIQYTTNGCPPALGFEREFVKACRDNNDQVFEVARRYDVSVVVMAGRWAAYENRPSLLRGVSQALAAWSACKSSWSDKARIFRFSSTMPNAPPNLPIETLISTGGPSRSTWQSTRSFVGCCPPARSSIHFISAARTDARSWSATDRWSSTRAT